jgi:hypothetical protein
VRRIEQHHARRERGLDRRAQLIFRRQPQAAEPDPLHGTETNVTEPSRRTRRIAFMAADLTAKLARLRLRTTAAPSLPDEPRSLRVGVERGKVTVKSGRRLVAQITPPLAGPELARLEQNFTSLPERDIVRLGAELARSLREPLHAFDDAAREPSTAIATTGAVEAAACLANVDDVVGARALRSMFAAAVYPLLLLRAALASASASAVGRMLAALERLGGSR